MARTVFTNNARTTLSAGINSVVTSIAVTDGSVFPSPTGGDWAYLTIESGADIEIVKLTARSGNTLTVTRAQDGTTAKTFASGASISLRLNKAALDEIYTELDGKALSTHTHTLSQISDMSAFARTLNDDVDAAAARTTLGLVIGTNVQAYNANLAAFAGLTLIADRLPYANGSGTLTLATLTAAGRALLDDADAAAQRTTLGLGSAALKNIGTSGDALGLLNTANTYSETQTFSNGSVGLAMSSRSPITFNGNANIRAWDSANTDIDALIPGTASGLMINGMINGHVVIGLRGNDTSDGFYIIDTSLGGSASYNRMLFELTPASLQYMGSNIAYESKAMTWGASHVWASGQLARFTSGLTIGSDNDRYIYPSGTKTISVRVGDSAAYKYFSFNEGGTFLTPDGSAGAPAFSFLSDVDTGMYRISANILGFATGGTERLRIGTNGAHTITADGVSTTALTIQGTGNGTIGPGMNFSWTNSGAQTPINQSIGRISWGGYDGALTGETWAYADIMLTDNTTGAEDSAFYLTLISGGTRGVKFTVTDDGTGTFANLMRTGVGAAATPAWSFASDPDTGIFRSAANTLNFATAGVSRMYIDSAGVIQFEGSARWTTANPLILDTAAATQRLTVYKSSALNRWAVGVDSGAESGSDVGSSYVFYAYNDAGAFTGTALSLARSNYTATFGGLIRTVAGSAASPSLSSSSDTNTGMFWSAADTLGWATGGTSRLSLSTSALTSAVVILAPAGSGGAPGFAFSTDTDTGLFLGGTNELRLVTNGSGRWAVQSTGHLAALANYSLFGGDGAVGAPGYSFTNDTNTGIYRIGADNLGFAAGGVLRFDISTTAATFAVDAVLSASGPTSVYSAGYRGTPINSQSGNYTAVLADAGCTIYYTGAGGHTATIPANASVAYPIGTTITFLNSGAGNLSIAITTDTMKLVGAGTTGTRTLASHGMATAVKVTATQWYISGNGLT